jgi:hypothetical protein
VIVILAVVALVALIAVVFVTAFLSDSIDKLGTERSDIEVRRAERRLHDVAAGAFRAMLDEARQSGPHLSK